MFFAIVVYPLTFLLHIYIKKMFELTGRRVIVTGAAQGFGKEFARRLLQGVYRKTALFSVLPLKMF